MAALEQLKSEGWSFHVGYSYDFQGYFARVWKPRPKPQKFRCQGGGDVFLFTWCVSSMGDSVEDAANKAAHLARTDPDGIWFKGLPIEPRWKVDAR